MGPGTVLLEDVLLELRRHKGLADKALADLCDEAFFRRPAEHVNPIALIVKHLAGNLTSRWTDFLTTDGDKPTRDRDSEFVLTAADTRVNLMPAWDRGWQAILATVQSLTPADLTREITIRGEKHTVQQSLLRGLNHAVYHIGQILYLARLFAPDRPWLTIAPGQSKQYRPGYLQTGK
jgi:uncharacterized damage-inducible protein DinB